MKYAFATTSMAALLLAMPALAQAPAANSADPASPANNASGNNASGNNASGATAQAPGSATGNGPQIIVKQPPPVVTVQPHAPSVTVTPGKPDVAVQQAPPKVDVTTPTPNVAVDTGKPDVKVLPAEKPDVAVKAPAGNANATAGSGSTTPPAAGTASVAPTAGVFPMANDVRNVIGKDVYGSNGNQVGEINNLLVGADGRVHAAVVEFGGFLGIGENKVAVPWDQLNITQDRITTNMTEDQVKAAPHWDKNRPGQFAEYQPLNK
jgi:sporulation protein YlmC with PRC-barrel domain